MSSSALTSLQAIQNSHNAFLQGDKFLARHWARIAASLDTDCEEAWLLMAAVASPQASVGYLKRALDVNPGSQRAQKGMAWALNRLEAAQQVSKTRPRQVKKTLEITRSIAVSSPVMVVKSVSAPQNKTNSTKRLNYYSNFIYLIILAFVSITLLVFSVWNTSPAQAFFSIQHNLAHGDHAPAWAQANIVKETMTLTASETMTETPTATPLPQKSPTPTSTETPIISPTAMPTDTPIPGQAISQMPSGSPDQTDTLASAGNKWILVDISEQHMYVYEGNTLIYSFVASTGMNNATRTGTFAVQSKIPNAFGATWNIWMPDWLGIYWSGGLENGIHALPILPNGATLWEGYLGSPISYGCVVLGSYEAQLLYNWVEIGTPVKIQW